MRLPQKPPSWDKIIDEVDGKTFQLIASSEVQEFVRSMNEKYLPWDHVRMQEMPPGLTQEVAWVAVQLSRSPQRQQLPITFGKNQKLHYWLPPHHHELVSSIDKRAGGYVATRHSHAIPDDDERYLVNSLMEEAIASSQLEGASTTREIAKEMLRVDRRPKDKAEQMILNNYNAILEIRDLKTEKLTSEMLCHLHEILTAKPLVIPKPLVGIGYRASK